MNVDTQLSFKCVVFYLFLIYQLTRCENQNEYTLRFVIAIFRHGDRSPTPQEIQLKNQFYKDDKHYVMGYGQLTNKGKNRMFHVGKYMRKRYVNFLGKNPREVTIESTAIDRCIESALLVAPGMYPPIGEFKWNKNCTFNPFSYLLSPSFFADCPFSTAFLNDINKIPKGQGNPLPKSALMQLQNKLFVVDVENNECNIKGALYYLKSIKNIMLKSIQEKFTKKIHLISTHDFVLASLMMLLRIWDWLQPPFGATLYIELYSKNENYYLKFVYVNVTETEETFELRPPETTNASKYSLDEFINTINKLESSFENGLSKDDITIIVLSSLIAVITLGLLIMAYLFRH